MLVTLLWFFLILGMLVLAHELGHFVTARAFKVKVEEFGLGYPPRIAGLKRGETMYSLNLCPLGGFTKLTGEEDPNIPGSFAGKSRFARFVILAAGAFMNAILPILLLSIAFMIPHNTLVGSVTVESVSPGSPAEAAGIAPGDVILEVNGRKIQNLSDLQRAIQVNLGKEVNILLKKSGDGDNTIKVVPRWKPPEGQGAIGIVLKQVDYTLREESFPFWQAIPRGVGETVEMYVLLRNGVVSMVIGAMPVQFGGPVAIAQVTGEVAKAGKSALLEFASLLSINLAIFNLLPVPALDGGRILFVLIEWLRRGKRVPPKVENLVHLIGFVILIALIVLVTFTDILRILRGSSLIP